MKVCLHLSAQQVMLMFMGFGRLLAQDPATVLQWEQGKQGCTSHIERDGAVRKVITSDGGNMAVGVTLGEDSSMLDVWLAVVSDRSVIVIDPKNVRVWIVTPVNKELSPIEQWKLNLVRIGIKERLRATTVGPGANVSGYILFPNEKKRAHVVVKVPIGQSLMEFPFDFSRRSRIAK